METEALYKAISRRNSEESPEGSNSDYKNAATDKTPIEIIHSLYRAQTPQITQTTKLSK